MTDRQLWQKLKDGDHKSYAVIYKNHIDYLLRYGFKITQEEATIEDAVHDLFVEIWKNRSTIGNTDNIRAYLTVSLRRKIIKSLKKSQKINSDKSPEEFDFQVELAVDDVIAKTEQDQEYAERLKNAMSQLGDRQKEALYLKFYSQMTNEQISEAMNITNQSVRNLIHRSLDQLKRIFIWIWIILFF